MRKIINILTILVTINLILTSCANDAGDKADCPTCDNKTEVLLGAKCVKIEEISECGPNGHAHGGECHCFSGQEETLIDGKKYCLQNACEEEKECNGFGELVDDKCNCEEGYIVDEHDNTKCMPLDLDDLACDMLDMDISDDHNATDTLNGEHIELEEKIVVNLIEDKESYVHFETTESTVFAVYVDQEDLLVDAFSKDGLVTFEVEKLGHNEDCSEKIKSVYHVEVEKQLEGEEKEPVVLKFKAHSGSISIFIHELHGKHEEHK